MHKKMTKGIDLTLYLMAYLRVHLSVQLRVLLRVDLGAYQRLHFEILQIEVELKGALVVKTELHLKFHMLMHLLVP